MHETMTRKRRRISDDTILKFDARQNHKCVYCGKTIIVAQRRGISWTLEHIVPRAVFKWLECSLTREEQDELHNLLESNDNLAIACYECNTRRGSSLPDKDSVDTMCVSDELKETYRRSICNLEKYISMYREVRHGILQRQDCTCAICGNSLQEENAILRRYNKHVPRIVQNGKAVCYTCNERESGNFWAYLCPNDDYIKK